MQKTDKQFIGVIAAEVNNIEQRQIMLGIIEKAQELGRKTVVFSNLYNPYEYDQSLALENSVYDLIFSQDLRGLIMISESILNETLREQIRALIEQRTDIPVIVIGLFVPALAFPNVTFINSSDAVDMADIVNHMLDVHHFRQIDILTGMENNGAAEQRVQGYRSALELHGIPFDERRVHYGNFWVDSGEALAMRYISGELPLPEAIVCANDYMAYGILDTFLANGIRVPEQVSVAGYEFISERIYHAPLLSTFQRGRKELGIAAVRMLESQAEGNGPTDFTPPRGRWIAGGSCPCGIQHDQLHGELEALRVGQTFIRWNVLGTLEQQLTLCSTLDEFIKVLGEHQYWVRWVQNMFLCLCENWYDTSAETPSELITCRSVMPWNAERPAVTCSRFDFSPLYQFSPEHAVHYYLPLFFEKHFFGYFVLEYHAPDAYDDIFRQWMKSISIGLTFLCMKNDIRYLLQCQNLSEQHDSLTGLYNQSGLEKALAARVAASDIPVHALALKTCTFRRDLTPDLQEEQTAMFQKIAELLRGISPEQSICARIDQQIFICAGFPAETKEDCEQIRERFLAVLLHQTGFLKTQGMESVICCCTDFQPDADPASCIAQVHAVLAQETAARAKQKNAPHAETLYLVRNQLYDTLDLSADNICRQYSFSSGYFRQIYKDCFGISFHQDAISARISRAVYLLTATVLSIASVAEQCGYEDYNYFLRQFQKVTGMTPAQFRKK